MDLSGRNNPRVLGLIPAKGGSTRLPRKNIKPLSGKPMLTWSVEAALDSGVIDELVVSTEDAEVARVAESSGAQVPFMRDPSLAVDPVGVEGVALNAIEQLEALGRYYDIIVILLPTSPLRCANHIRQAMSQFLNENARSLMSVCEFDHSPYSAYQRTASGLLEPVFPDKNRLKSQELPPAYRCNGAIHILNIPFFKEHKSYTCAPLSMYEMNRKCSVDVDTLDDFDYAEYLLSKKQ